MSRPDSRLSTHLAVCDCGSGPPLLLVHGFPLDHTMWQAQFDALTPDFRVIAPDLRGFGDSLVTEGTVTMPQHADDLALLLDQLAVEQPVVLCGLSMGGYIAWQFWRNYSDRLAGLILCDTRATADTEAAARGRRDMADRVMNDGTGFVADAMLPKLVADRTAAKHPDLVAALRATITGTAAAGIAAAQRGMAQRPDVTAWLAEITVPTLVLVGQYDEISPPDEMRAIAAAIGDSQFVEIPDAGHMAPMENPAAVNAAIRSFFELLGNARAGTSA